MFQDLDEMEALSSPGSVGVGQKLEEVDYLWRQILHGTPSSTSLLSRVKGLIESRAAAIPCLGPSEVLQAPVINIINQYGKVLSVTSGVFDADATEEVLRLGMLLLELDIAFDVFLKTIIPANITNLLTQYQKNSDKDRAKSAAKARYVSLDNFKKNIELLVDWKLTVDQSIDHLSMVNQIENFSNDDGKFPYLNLPYLRQGEPSSARGVILTVVKKVYLERGLAHMIKGRKRETALLG
ncbi:hypothetical protein GMLC_41780 [Geomonas limicola]|uniref:Uncharacterized protein n=3 Tax=Geobacteraceae TaxID=213422 RepID=A0A6V8MQ23_9BACT|nr:hypothetical protein GMST_43390 [Geomonas silvestris]GFO70599.1 hypothetical protein GMLC_41780 [Geomonas limicola]